ALPRRRRDSHARARGARGVGRVVVDPGDQRAHPERAPVPGARRRADDPRPPRRARRRPHRLGRRRHQRARVARRCRRAHRDDGGRSLPRGLRPARGHAGRGRAGPARRGGRSGRARHGHLDEPRHRRGGGAAPPGTRALPAGRGPAGHGRTGRDRPPLPPRASRRGDRRRRPLRPAVGRLGRGREPPARPEGAARTASLTRLRDTAGVETGMLILIVGAVLLPAVAAATLAGRAGVPDLVLFLAVGMLLGSDGPGGIDFSDVHLARNVGIVGLAVILFEGGITTPWRAIRRVAVPAASLSTVGIVVTMAITALVARAVFPLSWSASFLLGAVVASTDAAAVFSTLRVTNLRRRLGRVLEAESGANDPTAVALTIGLIHWVDGSATGIAELAWLVVRQLALGLVFGLAIGAAAAWALARLPDLAVPFAPVATVAAGAIGFGLTDVAGGSGFLAVY